MIGKQILFHIGNYFFMVKSKEEISFLIPKSARYDYFTPQLKLFIRQRDF